MVGESEEREREREREGGRDGGREGEERRGRGTDGGNSYPSPLWLSSPLLEFPSSLSLSSLSRFSASLPHKTHSFYIVILMGLSWHS